jgi:hypothetical protein
MFLSIDRTLLGFEIALHFLFVNGVKFGPRVYSHVAFNRRLLSVSYGLLRSFFRDLHLRIR